jgi:hypothetical protein
MQALAEQMTNQYSAVVQAATLAFITLVVTLFGVQILTQEADMKKDGFTLLFKIGVVWLMMDNFGGFIPDVFGILTELSALVSGVMSSTMGGIGSSPYLNCSGFEGEIPWRYYDCMLGALFGFAPDAFVGTSLIAAVPAALQSGQFGVMIFMAGVAAFLYVLRLIIRATYVYLMAIVALSFMIVVSPLFIPLLLMKKTESYFSRWLHAFMSLIGQPVMALAFMAFAVAVLDRTMTDSTFGILVLANSEEISEWQAQASNEGTQSFVSDCQNYFMAAGADPDDAQSDNNFDFTSPFLSCAAQLGLSSSQWTLDFGSDEASITQRLFFGLVMLVIIAYLLLMMMNTMMSVAAIMFGGAFYLREATSDNPLEAGMDKMQSTMSGQWHQSMGQINAGSANAGDRLAGFAGSGASSAVSGFIAGVGEATGMRR